jgi:PIN domain nuclease of toxin-antitoxin system
VNDLVLDASALLAVLQGEPGSDQWKYAVVGAPISAVNFSEVVAKLLDIPMPLPGVESVLDPLSLDVVAFSGVHAVVAAQLRAPTKYLGLSIGDRACLALAKVLGRRALTAERAWKSVDVGVTIVLIR